jgi:hypothetical protein
VLIGDFRMGFRRFSMFGDGFAVSGLGCGLGIKFLC